MTKKGVVFKHEMIQWERRNFDANCNYYYNNNSSSERGDEGENNSAKEGDTSLFDSLKYWNEKKDVFTELDARVAEKITKLSYIMYL